jgi:hypothetical protein
MTRQGDVNVNFGDAKTLSVGNVAMKTFVRKKFESLFQEKFESDGVALPGRWQMAGKMRLDQLNCGAAGWSSAGINRLSKPEWPAGIDAAVRNWDRATADFPK